MVLIHKTRARNRAAKHLRDHKRRTESQQSIRTCILCSKLLHNVEHIVEGDGGCVCSDCLLSSLLLLDESIERGTYELSLIDQLLVRRLNRTLEEGVMLLESDQPVADYLFVRYSSSESQWRTLIWMLSDAYNFECIRYLLSKVPNRAWSIYDAINWLWCCINLGDFEGALMVPKKEDLSKVSGNNSLELHFSLNLICAQIEADTSVANLERKLIDLKLLKASYDGGEYPIQNNWHAILPGILGAMAQCHLLLNRPNDALDFLSQRAKIAEPSEITELWEGDAYALLEHMDKARNHWEAGIELSTGSVYSARLRDRLGL